MDTGLVIGVINGIVLLVGYLLSRRGSKESNRQQTAANVLAEREADWKRRGEVIKDLEQLLTQKDRRISHLLAVCSAAQLSSIDTIAMLKQVLHAETATQIASLGIQDIKHHEQEEH